jgi:hypothetical protein
MAKTKNRFEQVDEIQPDAITLSLSKNGDKAASVIFPASASSGRLAEDSVAANWRRRTRSLCDQAANTMKVAVVVWTRRAFGIRNERRLSRYRAGTAEAGRSANCTFRSWV